MSLLSLLLAAAAVASAAANCGPPGYDLTPLARATDYTVSDSTGYIYNVNVCQPDRTGEPNCNAEAGTICQYSSTNQFVSVVAKWPGGSWSVVPPSSSAPNGGVIVNFNNGDICYTTKQARVSSIQFNCDPSQTISSFSASMTGCTYGFVASTKFACPSSLPACGPPGFDLSPLARATDYVAADAIGYIYKLNVCQPDRTSEPNCNAEAGTICQYSSNQFVSVVAKWPGGSWSVMPPSSTAPYGGVLLNFTNGDVCVPTAQPRQATVEFVCDPTRLISPVSVAATACSYSFAVATAYACAPLPSSCGPSGYDLSPLASASDYTAADSSGFIYKINVCQADRTVEPNCNAASGAICQYSTANQFVSAVARWPGAAWSTVPQSSAAPYGDVLGNFTNGDLCAPSMQPRVALLQLNCDPTQVLSPFTVTVNATGCTYRFTAFTMYAC